MKRRPRLAVRLMQAQALVVGIGTLTLVVSAILVAPTLFHNHLIQAGVADVTVQLHAEEAFASAFAISVGLAAVTSLLAAGAIAWLMVRRVSRPVEELAESAEIVATGRYDVDVPDATFSSELHQLSVSFSKMAQRLGATEATRSRLLANLAHELRTPLATLEAYVDGMEDDVLPHDEVSWRTMRDQINRLRRLATDVREVAAAEEHALGLRLERIDARDIARAAVAAAAPRFIGKGVELVARLGEHPCAVMGDAMRLQQVLANLLDNALRHTPVGGQVIVAVERAGSSVRLTVKDTGEGIPADQVGWVFERFHRVDPSRISTDGGGSGLGLTIARALVSDHSGSITAASPGTGLGTTMTIELPATEAGKRRDPSFT
ncbi:MAG: HAMP domain-containing protein [Actinobacteria bacterium]|uniref:histidine kinase n=1 Tax=freshwater metagenome TaxID=449393 RepID=A0A6J7AP35_9ZZZZ|nr:HAMP domain-containing protein [Actinomycetota bacterium]